MLILSKAKEYLKKTIKFLRKSLMEYWIKSQQRGYDSLSREEKEILFTASSQSDDEKSF